jgi:DNA-binding transcriptional MerR regulator
MRVAEAAARTGLTKKAIKYYEAQGLVTPTVDPQSGYRAYAEDDILRLELIHTLRLLDVPVAEIRQVLAGEGGIDEALQQALDRATAEIERLEEGRLILQSLLERETVDESQVREDVRRLRRAVELSREERRLHLSEAIERVFPGSFGRFMALVHAPFLDVELETEAQKARWLRLAQYLDDLDEPPADHPFFQLAHVEDEAAVIAVIEGQREHVAKLLDEDPDTIAAQREATAQFLRSLRHDPDARRRYEQRLAASEDLWTTITGSLDDEFNELLAALNDDYRRYLAIGQRILEEAEREVGYRLVGAPRPGAA